MIKIKSIKGELQITINNKKTRTFKERQDGYIYAEADEDNITFNDIKDVVLNSIPNKIELLIFLSDYNHIKYNFNFIHIKKENNTNFSIELSGDINSYKYSPEYFYPVFEKNFAKLSDSTNKAYCRSDDEYNKSFYCLLSIDESLYNKTMEYVFKTYSHQVDLIYKNTILNLEEKLLKENLSKENFFLKFNFPKSFKDLCKQYLSYFGKFLSDHNIERELSLIDRNDITYMTINVDDSQIDINELQKTLAGYFTLPIVSPENIAFNNQNIATQQLIANIEHLKSQLRLANLTIARHENNNAINTQRPIEYVLIDSLDEESKLKLFDGFIKVGKVIKLKFLGVDIEFDMPLLIDKVKRRHKNND